MITCTYKWTGVPNDGPHILQRVLSNHGFNDVYYNVLDTRFDNIFGKVIASYTKYELDISSEDFLILKLKDPNFINCTA